MDFAAEARLHLWSTRHPSDIEDGDESVLAALLKRVYEAGVQSTYISPAEQDEIDQGFL